jgi:hypothetical protein
MTMGRILCLITLFCGGVGLWAQSTVEMVRKVKPSVVTVRPTNAFGLEESFGSGFFIAPDRVVTNHHVIEGAYGANIILNDSTILKARHIVAMDTARDIAILAVNVPPGRTIPTLSLNTKRPQQGERVYVVGNPLGFDQSVSDGIVASIRTVPSLGQVIQFTSAISPGNSGSPLLDEKGSVYGVAQSTIVEGQNLNFAIPAEVVQSLRPDSIIAFAPVKKKYGVEVLLPEYAFIVDTTLRGVPPSGLSLREANLWRLKLAGKRQRWDTAVVTKQMNRYQRILKRLDPLFDLDKDTLTMTDAESVVLEAMGYNLDVDTTNPALAEQLSQASAAVEYVMASLGTQSEVESKGFIATTITTRAQQWVECEKGEEYFVYGIANEEVIKDLDVAVLYWDGTRWKAVAANTDSTNKPATAFTAPETAEYAVVWRVADRLEDGTQGILVGGIFKR